NGPWIDQGLRKPPVDFDLGHRVGSCAQLAERLARGFRLPRRQVRSGLPELPLRFWKNGQRSLKQTIDQATPSENSKNHQSATLSNDQHALQEKDLTGRPVGSQKTAQLAGLAQRPEVERHQRRIIRKSFWSHLPVHPFQSFSPLRPQPEEM